MKNFIRGILFVVFGRRFLLFVLEIAASPNWEDALKKAIAEKTTKFLFPGDSVVRNMKKSTRRESPRTRYDQMDPKERARRISEASDGATYNSRIFNSENRNWCSDPQANKLFLRSVQNHMNNLLETRGHVFLNEIYDALGFARTRNGALTGWVKGGGDPINFSYHQASDDASQLLIQFMSHGLIYDKFAEATR